MNLRLVFLVTVAVNAVASFAAPHDAHAESTPPTCDREEVHACSGFEVNAPCDADPTTPGKCVMRNCMADPMPDGTPVGSIGALTCVWVNTCELLSALPDYGKPCAGKAIGSTCESKWLPAGGKCVVSSSCEELAADLGVYVAGRYVTCGRDREHSSGADPAPSDGSSGCSAAPSTTSGSLLVVGVLGVWTIRGRRASRQAREGSSRRRSPGGGRAEGDIPAIGTNQ